MLDRRDWRRYLSPVDKEWAWQDSPYITAVRELLLDFSSTPRAEGTNASWYEARAATRSQLRVLQVLEAAHNLTAVLQSEIEHLVLELRAREVSWEVIGMALGCRRQSAQEKYGKLKRGSFYWSSRLVYEVDAARRVALEISQSAKSTKKEREEALDFLDRSDFNTQARTTKALARRYR